MTTEVERTEFKAEIKQVLDILIHSLYTEKEIFLRELVSNASDALHRFKLESLKSQEVTSPGAELGIWIEGDLQSSTLTIRDTGIGLTQAEMVAYLGTIASSGAKQFIETMKEINQGDTKTTADVIGQFGVGFYSVFMVADKVTVTSRSYKPEAEAAFWRSTGEGTFETGPADKEKRGTIITIKLKDDAKEFAEAYRLRQIVKEHSDFVAFPIYLKEKDEWQQVNERTALWREQPQSVEAGKYRRFYQGLTFDPQEPLRTIHFTADMPIQFYALLFIPSRRDHKLFTNADDYGLKLYARKVLIQDEFKELLPPYLRFLEGVVDSEDLPLNVSRETVQATPTVARIRKVLVGRVATELERMAEHEPEQFEKFYEEFGTFLKEGVASDPSSAEKFIDLLRFPSTQTEGAETTSLKAYTERMKPEQKEIYYVLGDDVAVVARSSHLEYFRKHSLEVLYLTDPIDSFMLMGLNEYGGKALKNIDDADLDLPEADEKKLELPKDEKFIALTAFVKQILADPRGGGAGEQGLDRPSGATGQPRRGRGRRAFNRAQRLMGPRLRGAEKDSGTQSEKPARSGVGRAPASERSGPAVASFNRSSFMKTNFSWRASTPTRPR